MGLFKDASEWLFHLSGFIVIGSDFFLPIGFLEKTVVFVIGALLVVMIWIK